MALDDEFDSTTFRVYVHVVKEGKPVGPREIMRAANLSSPSVAYRHLQKLENLSLIQKNSYGEYVVKEKINVKGHIWVGRNLVPRLLFYSFFFMGILSVEIVIIAVRFSAAEAFDVDFLFLTFITIMAFGILLLEGMRLLLKVKNH